MEKILFLTQKAGVKTRIRFGSWETKRINRVFICGFFIIKK
jgi:hypothetical protein